MSGVIFLHYFNADAGAGVTFVKSGSLNELILYILEAINICAVNLFIMISAYFLSKSQKRTIGKCIKILLQVIIYRLIVYMCGWLCFHESFSIRALLASFLPINWFIICYVALYLISPLINLAYQYLSLKAQIQMTFLIIFLFSFQPTMVDILSQLIGSEVRGLSTIGMYGSERGYTITQFVVCYCVGLLLSKIDLNNIKIKKMELKQIHLLAMWIIEVLIITLWGCYINPYTGREYCNPFILCEAVTILVLFLRIDIGVSSIINSIASSAISVYLLHNFFIRFANIPKYVNMSAFIMIGHIFITITVVVFLSWIFDGIYKKTMRSANKRIENIGIFVLKNDEIKKT